MSSLGFESFKMFSLDFLCAQGFLEIQEHFQPQTPVRNSAAQWNLGSKTESTLCHRSLPVDPEIYWLFCKNNRLAPNFSKRFRSISCAPFTHENKGSQRSRRANRQISAPNGGQQNSQAFHKRKQGVAAIASANRQISLPNWRQKLSQLFLSFTFIWRHLKLEFTVFFANEFVWLPKLQLFFVWFPARPRFLEIQVHFQSQTPVRNSRAQ